jgi:LacI family transcriptional regulator
MKSKPSKSQPSDFATGQATIRDIAIRAKVTPTTVSSALHDTGRVSAQMRQRIEAIARELGYQPKLAAQLMRAKQTGQIGLILPGNPAQSGEPGPIMSHFVTQCESRGLNYHIELHAPSSDFKPPVQLVNGLVQGILLGGYVDAELQQWLAAQERWPWVSLEEKSPLAVFSASDEGVYRAFEHLAGLGHRRIAYMGGPTRYLTHRLGKLGLTRSMRDFDLDLGGRGNQWIGTFKEGRRIDLIRASAVWAADLLRRSVRPTAFVCHGINLARGVVYEAMRLGLDIPGDLSLFAVGTNVEAERALPCLSTIETDYQTMVAQGLDLLQSRIQGNRIDTPERRVPPKLVLRDTVSVPSH